MTSPPRMNLGWQLAAWGAAVAVCLLGFQGVVAEWPAELALYELLTLLTLPFVWLISDRWSGDAMPSQQSDANPDPRWTQRDTLLAVGFSALALTVTVVTGLRFGTEPPAYHDEYSYLFEAQLISQGCWSRPSPSVFPELFDQMHVLNEGRMASRYYPGTATWLAPWVVVGYPVIGAWLAGSLAVGLVYAIGRELGGRMTGVIAAMLLAVAPGPALFHNLLLAHSPCLLALGLFLLGFLRGIRTNSMPDFALSGVGLGGALLCRPATAVGLAAPFGLWCAWIFVRERLARPKDTPPRTRVLLMGYGVPLLVTVAVAMSYNRAATGSWTTSPYQLYTDLYTPRHVYGLNNVVRGEQALGPKVLDDYDRWAENLTPAKAHQNSLNRLVISGLWTVGVPLLAASLVWGLRSLLTTDPRWACLAWGWVGLHAIHWPYWYVGIMGWHYVFETCLVLVIWLGALVASVVRQAAPAARGPRLAVIGLLVVLAWSGMYLDNGEGWESRWRKGGDSIAFPRREHAQFRAGIARSVQTPALVLIDQSGGNPHLDLVVNDASLAGPILYGRFRPGVTDAQAVARAFPERRVYLAQPASQSLILISVTQDSP